MILDKQKQQYHIKEEKESNQMVAHTAILNCAVCAHNI